MIQYAPDWAFPPGPLLHAGGKVPFQPVFCRSFGGHSLQPMLDSTTINFNTEVDRYEPDTPRKGGRDLIGDAEDASGSAAVCLGESLWSGF